VSNVLKEGIKRKLMGKASRRKMLGKLKPEQVLVVRDRPMDADDNYMAPLLKVAEGTHKGSVAEVTIRHDDWCAIWRGGRCDCKPIVKVEKEWT